MRRVTTRAANADLMTQPTDVETFIAQTGIDLLAVSVGTAHGMYAPLVLYLLLIFSVWRRFRAARACLWHYMAVAVRRSISSSSVRRWGVAKNQRGGRPFFERGKSALLHTLCHDISIELVDALKAMELAFEEAITPYLQASGSIGKA